MNNVARISFFAVITKLAGFFKTGFLIGSFYVSFSPSSVIVPLSGAVGGNPVAFGLFVMRFALHMALGGMYALKSLAFCVPGFFASLYWANDTFLCRVVVPVACMVAFIANPAVGSGAAYALYWFIPLMCYALPSRNPFFTALGSTFVAHAVGSVIWSYTVPMTPALWLGLIPVVLVERIAFASAMTVLYYGIELISSFSLKAKQPVSHKQPMTV